MLLRSSKSVILKVITVRITAGQTPPTEDRQLFHRYHRKHRDVKEQQYVDSVNIAHCQYRLSLPAAIPTRV
jgi:hypothetical protein